MGRWSERTRGVHAPRPPFDDLQAVGGYYHQTPFYREMRGLDGTINPDIQPQRAIHAVAGVDHQFESQGRPFKWVGELYYKDLSNLIPYEIENVRQRYYATNNSSGYATGLDMMLNGEFIPGIQSWLRMSVLKTEEDLDDDFYLEYFNADGLQVIPGYHTGQFALVDRVDTILPGFIPRPADQRFSFSLLFQDEMPRNPEYKVLLSLFSARGCPTDLPPSIGTKTSCARRLTEGSMLDSPGCCSAATRHATDSSRSRSSTFSASTTRSTTIGFRTSTAGSMPCPTLTGRRLNLKVSLSF